MPTSSVDSKPFAYGPGGAAARTAAGTVATANVAIMADAEARLASRRFVEEIIRARSFSRFQPRRMQAEILYDAVDAVTLTKQPPKGYLAGTRAVTLPDNLVESYFLSVFGRPDNASACECERSGDSSLAQSLHLYNSLEIEKKTAGDRLKKLVADKRPIDEKLTEIYLIALSRSPRADDER